MPVFPIPHFEWQVLRTVLRSPAAPRGRDLRLVPTRRTKDGEFLTRLVERGLLRRLSGADTAPFDATYALTEKGQHAAEYGECEMSTTTRVAVTAPVARPVKKAKNGRRMSR
jgi:hypothetical protein